MEILSILCSILILGGALIIGLSTIQACKIIRKISNPHYRYFWRLLTALMVIFFAGYIAAIFMILNPNLLQLEMLLALVFCLAAVFVFLTVYVSRLTFERLHELKEKLKQEAILDALTGLPNRRLLNERLKQCLARYQRWHESSKDKDKRRYFAVLILDLDDFKLINDTLGHQAGDLLLIEVGQRLKKCLRVYDTLYRLGGDEFCIILEELKTANQIVAIVERILNNFEGDFEFNQHPLKVNCSIGIASNFSPYSEAEKILEQADLALYLAKSQGKKCYAFFTPELQKANLRRFALENQLRQTLQTGDLALYLHPIVNLSNREIIGYEGLVRFPNLQNNQELSIQDLIQIAEDINLIQEIDFWMLEKGMQALSQIRQDNDGKNISTTAYISLNLSGKTLKSNLFEEQLENLLKIYHLSPQDVAFELKEDVLIAAFQDSPQRLQRIQEQGYQLFIDDFGTGSSSLRYLHLLPVTGIKIDRFFVSQLTEGNRAILKNLRTLSHEMNLKTIVEGVESQEACDWLISVGHLMAQGHLFSYPQPFTID